VVRIAPAHLFWKSWKLFRNAELLFSFFRKLRSTGAILTTNSDSAVQNTIGNDSLNTRSRHFFV